jgi:SAM-dependent methyltransferase
MTNRGSRIIHDEVAAYYSAKLAEHGESPRGVDWNGEEGQILRFRQLCRVIDGTTPFSVNDLGSGYGAMFDYLAGAYPQFSYLGVDVSESMIEAARRRYADRLNASFECANAPSACADYGIASGIFNVCQGRSNDEWLEYILETLDVLDRSSRRGFAFNCLTSYSDADRMRDDLYYADPCRIFDLCKRRYSRNVALLHDYDLYEFTMIVRKPT